MQISQPWIGAKQAAEQYSIPKMTLVRWYRDGCPFLGRRLRTKRLKNQGPTSGPKLLVSVSDLDHIENEKMWNGEYTDDAGKWISTALAETTYGYTRDRLDSAKADGHLRGKRVVVGNRGRYGNPIKLIWHGGDLANLAAGITADPNWLTSSEVSDRYGYSQPTLWKWRTKGCPFLGGRKLRSRLSHRTYKRSGPGQPCNVMDEHREYHKADLDEITKHYKTDPQATADADWLSYREAVAEYGVKQWQLSEWATKECPRLGRRLASRKVIAGVGNRPMKVTKYSRADLEKIVGDSPAEPIRKRAEGIIEDDPIHGINRRLDRIIVNTGRTADGVEDARGYSGPFSTADLARMFGMHRNKLAELMDGEEQAKIPNKKLSKGAYMVRTDHLPVAKKP